MGRFLKKIFRYLWLGTLSILPLIIVLQIFFWLQKILINYFHKAFAISEGNYILIISIFLSIFIFLIIVGYSIEKYGKSIFISFIDRIMQNIPLLKTIYNFVKDFLKMVFVTKESEVFRDVVLVPFPNSDLKSVGFVTNKIDEENYIVFVPTCPNPTSGFTFIVKKDDIKFLNIGIDEAMKMIVSVGAVAEDNLKKDLSG
ncbi:DUF502 domain-containing protein [Nitrosophilus kaiyonis]|uniref:DUF502 domain-containing protein n=1 Tax=Nitrosophilus kaiyonis TaxID=2930200 RepID=UPI00248F609E|nr:DUF502 domain-containing protein [Nitrosophilus kaiyonis]